MTPDSALPGTRVRAGVIDLVVLAPAPTSRRDRWRILTPRRAAGTRCTGAWEIVHGRIETGETPADAAVRELREETGMTADRLYSISVNPFYLHQTDSVELAIVFAALVSHASIVSLGEEHDSAVWRTPAAAAKHLAWPREREAVAHALALLATGDAGPVEDVLRVR